MELYIIDAISPFFATHASTTINWSKIPFNRIETDGRLKKRDYKAIKERFKRYIDQISQIGYNAISIDDLSHMVVMNYYSPTLKKKIAKYQRRFRKLLQGVAEHNLAIYITTDVMFYNDDIRQQMAQQHSSATELLAGILTALFEQMPLVNGVILRLGEADGVDVRGDFCSELTIQTPQEANQLLKRVLPLFEAEQKRLIFRTWTVGAREIGDMNWNPTTYHKVFADIESQALTISMKPGEGDFFRYLELNRHFLTDRRHSKLLELQTRREYEGFGSLPNFVGWEHERLARQLRLNCPTLIGIHVWCQTGGWSARKHLAYLDNSSWFTELNTLVTLRIFKQQQSPEEVIAELMSPNKRTQLLEFLRLAEELIDQLLYIEPFAIQTLYLHRVRIPPLLYLFWDSVTLTTPLQELFRRYLPDPERALQQAELAFANIERMESLNRKLKLPYDQAFYRDTCELLLRCRYYLLQQPGAAEELQQQLHTYRSRYPDGLKVVIHQDSALTRGVIRQLLPLFIRHQPHYRRLDKLLFNRFTAPIYPLLLRKVAADLPDFADKQAMPLHELLV
ncbi:glycosyl hydrolase family 67 [Ectothiorhodospiraceae bacterium BW-2]|nr:glycosyl hydrolase family 67 [Ectothiorhodospiraceae bacterium BW-2]